MFCFPKFVSRNSFSWYFFQSFLVNVGSLSLPKYLYWHAPQRVNAAGISAVSSGPCTACSTGSTPAAACWKCVHHNFSETAAVSATEKIDEGKYRRGKKPTREKSTRENISDNSSSCYRWYFSSSIFSVAVDLRLGQLGICSSNPCSHNTVHSHVRRL